MTTSIAEHFTASERRPFATKRTHVIGAVGVPYSTAGLRKGGVTQRLCAAPSSRPPSHGPTRCSCMLAGSPAPPWVAGLPVAFLVATPRWPPDRCAAGLDFLWGAEAREGRHLVSSGGQAHAGHVSEQYAGRLDLVAVRLSPVPFHRGGRPSWDGRLYLGPLPSRTARRRHRRIAPTVQYRRGCA